MCNSITNININGMAAKAIPVLDEAKPIVKYFPVEVHLFGTIFIFDSAEEIEKFKQTIIRNDKLYDNQEAR